MGRTYKVSLLASEDRLQFSHSVALTFIWLDFISAAATLASKIRRNVVLRTHRVSLTVLDRCVLSDGQSTESNSIQT